jgi:dihydropteroate synthase
MNYNKPKVIGILNITPDSFSDGGLYNTLEKAIAHTKKLLLDGADIIDIGAESTRNEIKPFEKNHHDITQEQPIKLAGAGLEWQRLEELLPILCKIIKEAKKEISLDSKNPTTVAKALKYDIDYINDVSGCDNPAMIDLVAKSSAKIIIMHNLGIPADPKVTMNPDIDIIAKIKEWLLAKADLLEKSGINKSRIILDPGITFGKTAEQSMEIIRGIGKFVSLGFPVLVGHSRKSIYNLYTDVPRNQRDIETYATSTYLALQGVDYIRVHDVAGNIRSLNVTGGIYG